LRPLLIARVTAASSAGLGREVFETLNDALDYIDLALDSAGNPGASGKGATGDPAAAAMASAESHFASGAEDLAEAQAAIMAHATSQVGLAEQSGSDESADPTAD
jgi:hypothetical protein